MQLKRLQEFAGEYKKSLIHAPPDGLFKWESQRIWQENFTLDTRDFVEMFDRALENSTTRRLWHREQFFPKKMMLEFWRRDPMTLKAAFDDLFDETKLVENRLSRFVFALDILLADLRAGAPNTRLSEHFHTDFQLPSLYLAFQFPADHAPYDFTVFQQVLIKLNSLDIPLVSDPARWFKIARTVHNLLVKDNELVNSVNRWIKPNVHYSSNNLLLVDDFCRFVCQR